MRREQEFAAFLAKTKADIELLARFEEPSSGVSQAVLDGFFELGMVFHHRPDLKESEAFKQFYKNTLRLLRGPSVDIDQFPRLAREMWEHAARDWADYNGDGGSRHYRSALQFYIDIYGESLILTEPLEEIDEAFRKKQDDKDIYAVEERTDVPPSHWWWRHERPEDV